MELLEKGAKQNANPGAQREWDLLFLRSPSEILVDTSDRVTGIRFEINELQGNKVYPTGAHEDHECGLVFRSIGYKSVPVPGLPFDHGKGIVPNNKGRVLDVGDVPEKVGFRKSAGLLYIGVL